MDERVSVAADVRVLQVAQQLDLLERRLALLRRESLQPEWLSTELVAGVRAAESDDNGRACSVIAPYLPGFDFSMSPAPLMAPHCCASITVSLGRAGRAKAGTQPLPGLDRYSGPASPVRCFA